MRKVKMNVQGRVQGVGFRYMTKMVADQLGVTGTVKNEDDGSVTIEAIGNDDIIQKFIEEVKKSRAQVDECSMWMSKKIR